MNGIDRRVLLWFAALPLLAAWSYAASEPDVAHAAFPEAQAELREAVEAIAQDAMNADLEGLQEIHLESEKFTKFGPRSFERQDVESTNRSEAAFFGSVSDLVYEVEDLKIDVFGTVAVVTYYPHVSFLRDGEEMQVEGRQTLVFLETAEGWKIVHEHGTVRPREASRSSLP